MKSNYEGVKETKGIRKTNTHTSLSSFMGFFFFFFVSSGSGNKTQKELFQEYSNPSGSLVGGIIYLLQKGLATMLLTAGYSLLTCLMRRRLSVRFPMVTESLCPWMFSWFSSVLPQSRMALDEPAMFNILIL